MNNRIVLQKKLEEILGSRNVYFQSPENLKMSYPCIRYALNRIDEKYADDISYLRFRSYTLTLIDKNPDSPYLDKLLDLKRCRFDRAYVADNLHHFIFTIYI